MLMSIEYGVIRGYGVELEDIERHIDHDKVLAYIKENYDYEDDMPIDDLPDLDTVLEAIDMTNGLVDIIAEADPHNRLQGAAFGGLHFF